MPDEQRIPIKPNDDPALAMSRMWREDWDRFLGLCSAASKREKALFKASNVDRAALEQAFIVARDERDRLGAQLGTFADALVQIPARSVAGATSKLAVAILQNEPKPNYAEAPWPLFRSTLQDLDRLAETERTAAA